jgi:pimeloyl-ACP methyl ester carboxylesterase
VGYFEDGPVDGEVVILCHELPYSIGVYIDMVPLRINRGYRVVVSYLRGFGETTFLYHDTPRTEQSAPGFDLVALMDALHIKEVILEGFDWGSVSVNVSSRYGQSAAVEWLRRKAMPFKIVIQPGLRPAQR